MFAATDPFKPVYVCLGIAIALALVTYGVTFAIAKAIHKKRIKRRPTEQSEACQNPPMTKYIAD